MILVARNPKDNADVVTLSVRAHIPWKATLWTEGDLDGYALQICTDGRWIVIWKKGIDDLDYKFYVPHVCKYGLRKALMVWLLVLHSLDIITFPVNGRWV